MKEEEAVLDEPMPEASGDNKSNSSSKNISNSSSNSKNISNNNSNSNKSNSSNDDNNNNDNNSWRHCTQSPRLKGQSYFIPGRLLLQ